MISTKLLMGFVIKALLWGLTYYFIRRRLNPENEGKVEKFQNDAIYGSIAAFISGIAYWFINSRFIEPSF